jgi:hypothetical protein
MDMRGDTIGASIKKGRGINPLQVDMGNPGYKA